MTDHHAACCAAYLGARPWPVYAGVPAWEANARSIADRALGCALAFGASAEEADRAWGEAFESARYIA